jgi:hypothetical protein
MTRFILQVVAICSGCNLRATARAVVFIAHNATHLHHPLIVSALTRNTVGKIKPLSKSDREVLALSISRQSNCIDFRSFINATLDESIKRMGVATPELFPIATQKFTFEQIKLFIAMEELPLTSRWATMHLNESELPKSWVIFEHSRNIEITNSQFHAMHQLFQLFKCRTVREFVKHYLYARCLLLADVCSHFTKTCVEAYRLSPLHCVSLSQYSYNVAMFMIQGRYEQIRDPRIIEFLEMRGGMNFSVLKFAKSISERLGDFNVADEDRTEILGCDLNSEYASIMMEYLGCEGYEWMTENELENYDFATTPQSPEAGFIFKVDIEYKTEFDHFMNSDFPLAPHKINIACNNLSIEQQQQVQSFTEHAYKENLGKSLSLDLLPKTNYVVSAKNLAYYLNHGMKITKVHEGLKFQQRPLFQKFVEKTLQLRKAAQEKGDTIGSDLFKIIYSGVSGKFASSTRDYLRTETVTSRARALRLASKHNFNDFQVISSEKGLAIFKMRPMTIQYHFPYLIGFQIYEHSKLALYQGYEAIRKQFGLGNVRVLAGHTDSLYLEIKDPFRKFVKHLQALSDYFDFSNLDKSEELYSTHNSLVPGKFKIINFYISEFISIKCSCYSYSTVCKSCRIRRMDFCKECETKETHKGRGIGALKKIGYRHRDYFKLLQEETGFQLSAESEPLIKKRKMVTLNVTRHQINSIDSLPFGHYLLNDQTQESIAATPNQQTNQDMALFEAPRNIGLRGDPINTTDN